MLNLDKETLSKNLINNCRIYVGASIARPCFENFTHNICHLPNYMDYQLCIVL